MKTLLKNPYFIAYSVLYCIVLVLMAFIEHFQVSQAIAVVLIIGILFTSVAYFPSKSSEVLSLSKPVQNREGIALISLLIYYTLSLTFGIEQIKTLLSPLYLESLKVKELITMSYKLILFVVIPFLVYRFIYSFNLIDFGLRIRLKDFFNRKNIVILLSMFFVLFVFQFFLGNGGKPFREGLISSRQMLIGFPFFYVWLIFEVGLVEEFFFRGLVQSRLAALTKSEIGGIVLSAVFFGLAHAPGMYLRGGGSMEGIGQNPSLFIAIGYSILVLSVAGFFLSVIWSKTRNLWLVIAIHAFVDVIPGLQEFINIWGIHE